MCAALVVAFAEIVLYMIWDSRQTSRPRQAARKDVLIPDKDAVESNSAQDIVPQASSTALGDTAIRHRTTASRTKHVS